MAKLLVMIVTLGSLAGAVYTGTQPPATTSQGRAAQSIKHASDAEELRQKNRRYELLRSLEVERQRQLQAAEVRAAETLPSELIRLAKLLPELLLRIR